MSEVVDIFGQIFGMVSNFLTSFFEVLTGSLNPEAVEGILALFAISIIYRIFNGGVSLPKRKSRRVEEYDEDEEEWILMRRRRR